jgi:hypothetical protein
MSNELRTLSPDIISKLVIGGDLSGLTPIQKVEFYNYRCQQAGLDPAAKPFDLLTLNGKQILYANATATQQLTGIHNLSHAITGRELTDGIYCVFCRVTSPDGRSTENMGAVPVDKLQGEAKANAFLKATTKAIRRTVLAHMGLGLMDETEVETIPGAARAPMPALQGEVIPPPPIPVTEGWPTEALAEFEGILDRAYQAFKLGGMPESFEKFSNTWKPLRVGDPEPVLNAMDKATAKLENAAAASAAKKKGGKAA